MNTSEVLAYTRSILDDPNKVFLSDAALGGFLDIAYGEFRSHAADEVFEQAYSAPVVTGVWQIDLNGILFGAGAQNRAQRLTRVQAVDLNTGRLLYVLKPESSFEALGQLSTTTPSLATVQNWTQRWWLDGRILRFSAAFSGKLEIWYMPQRTFGANWIGANFLDDLEQFHDVIALLAAQQYAMKDGAGNAKIDERLARRLADMDAFFAQTRSGKASRYVSDEKWV